MIAMAAEVLSAGGWGPGPWWPIFPLFWIVAWGAVLFAVLRLRRRDGRERDGHSIERILAERYARGEIGVEEYRERLSVLAERAS